MDLDYLKFSLAPFSDNDLNSLPKLLARYELYKQTINLPGDIVEAGVLRGSGALFWAALIQIFNPQSRRKVIGFDTFDDSYKDLLNHKHDRVSSKRIFGQHTTPFTRTPQEIETIADTLLLSNRLELIQGNATETIKQYVESNPGFRIALLNLDFDTYEPTAAALKYLYDLVVPHGIIILDEYSVRGWGESDAADLFFVDKKIVYESISWSSSPKAYVIKPAS